MNVVRILLKIVKKNITLNLGILKIIIPLLLIIIFAGCSNKDDNSSQEPENLLIITNFSPMEASVGDEITFNGQNIDVSKEYYIKFNGVTATSVENFPSQLKAIVPEGATSGEVTINYDDNSLSVGSLTILEELQLIITSFFPTEVYTGDAVIFVGENIDSTIAYTVTFNGVEGETLSVSETEIVTVVPEGATSGEIVISYEDSRLNVGTIEITQELDKLYGYLNMENYCGFLDIFNIDRNSGELLEQIALLEGGDCYSGGASNFYRNANIFIYDYYEYLGQGVGYLSKKALIKDFNTGNFKKWHLESAPTDPKEYILAADIDKIYYIYQLFNGIDNVYEIRSSNVNASNQTTLYELPTDFIYEIDNSGFLPSTNELVFFTTDASGQQVFMKFDLEASTLNSSPVLDIYSSIFISTNERILGVKDLGNNTHEIVEIDKNTGNIAAVLTTIQVRRVRNIDYSTSSNRIYALLEESYENQMLYKLNLEDGTSTTTPLDEQNLHLDFLGIYLND